MLYTKCSCTGIVATLIEPAAAKIAKALNVILDIGTLVSFFIFFSLSFSLSLSQHRVFIFIIALLYVFIYPNNTTEKTETQA